MGFRDYNPGLNTFTTRDNYNGALDDLGLGNDPFTGTRYAYGAGNPISNIELDGHMAVDINGNPAPSPTTTVGGKDYADTHYVEMQQERERASSAGAPAPVGPGSVAVADRVVFAQQTCDPRTTCDDPYYPYAPGTPGAGTDCSGSVQCAIAGVAIAATIACGVVTDGACFAALGEAATYLPGGEAFVGASTTTVGVAGVGAGDTTAVVAARTVRETCNSFTGQTLVLMADGTRKPIKDVKLGDWVMAKNPITGLATPRQVIDLIRHSGPHTMVKIRLSDGTVIDATDHHPLWVKTDGVNGDWTNAIDLTAGDVLLTSAGETETVAGVEVSEQDLTAYNLTIDDLHTYYVSGDDVLVHNAACPFDVDAALKSGQAASKGKYSAAGRALQKKLGRSNAAAWPSPAGKADAAAYNEVGENLLMDMLTDPAATWAQGRGRIGGQWSNVWDMRLPNGTGARFDMNGSFETFLD